MTQLFYVYLSYGVAAAGFIGLTIWIKANRRIITKQSQTLQK